jgi:hypothetical protein
MNLIQIKFTHKNVQKSQCLTNMHCCSKINNREMIITFSNDTPVLSLALFYMDVKHALLHYKQKVNWSV